MSGLLPAVTTWTRWLGGSIPTLHQVPSPLRKGPEKERGSLFGRLVAVTSVPVVGVFRRRVWTVPVPVDTPG